MLCDPLVLGTICGLSAAFGYTAANVFLRAAADCDPIWVSAVKAFPTVVLAFPWLWWESRRGTLRYPSRRQLQRLVGASLFGQVGGNVAFQWSLGVIGMSLTVPLTMASVIFSGAIIGRIFLQESVTLRSAIALIVLVAATFVLSLSASRGPSQHRPTGRPADAKATDVFPRSKTAMTVQSDRSAARPSTTRVPWAAILAGVAASLLAGVAYAVLGAVIRLGVTNHVSAEMTLFVVCGSGLIVLGALTLASGGWPVIAATTARQMGVMLCAGICNFAAFWALAVALRLTPLAYVNALNTSQVAMAAVAGVLLFRETSSWSLWLGVALTVGGLLLVQVRRSTRPTALTR